LAGVFKIACKAGSYIPTLPVMSGRKPSRLQERLSRLKDSPDCQCYLKNVPFSSAPDLLVPRSTATWPTRLIFVEVTNSRTVHVRLFLSRLKHLPPEAAPRGDSACGQWPMRFALGPPDDPPAAGERFSFATELVFES